MMKTVNCTAHGEGCGATRTPGVVRVRPYWSGFALSPYDTIFEESAADFEADTLEELVDRYRDYYADIDIFIYEDRPRPDPRKVLAVKFCEDGSEHRRLKIEVDTTKAWHDYRDAVRAEREMRADYYNSVL